MYLAQCLFSSFLLYWLRYYFLRNTYSPFQNYFWWSSFPDAYRNLTIPLKLKTIRQSIFRTSCMDLSLLNRCIEVSLQSLSHVWLFATPWTAACQASLSITNSQSLLKLKSIELVMPSNHLILCHLLSSYLQPFLAWGSFQMSQFFASGNQSIGASAWVSVLSINIQGWSPLGFSGFISLQFKGLLRVFSSTIVWKHQFFGAQPSLWSNSHIHTWPLEKS